MNFQLGESLFTMSQGKEPIYITDIISRLRVRKSGYLVIFFISIVSSVFLGLIWSVVKNVTAPYNRRSRIRNWLNSEPNLVSDFELEKSDWGQFRFEIETRSGLNVIVHTLNRRVIRIYAVQEIDPGALAAIEEHGDLRNDLIEIIEAVLANIRGSYTYLDKDREPCDISKLDSLAIEYRFYSDGFSKQEFMNTLLDFERAMAFVNRRVEQMSDNLRDQT